MTDGTGLAPEGKLAPGQRKIQQLKAAEFSDEAVAAWVQRTQQRLLDGGATQSALDAYWGTGVNYDHRVGRFVQQNIQAATEANPEIADNPAEAFAAGFQMSVSGLAMRGQRPDKQLAPDAGFVDILANATGQTIGDLPATVAGFFGGGAAGGAAGTTVFPGLGTAVGGVVGAGAGSAFAPEATRQVLLANIDYGDGKIRTMEDVKQTAVHAAKEVGKQTVIGAVTAPVGAGGATIVKGALAKTGAKLTTQVAVGGAADAVIQATTATAMFAAMEGRGMRPEDIEAAIAMSLGFHSASMIASYRSYRAGKNNDGPRRVRQNVKVTSARTGHSPGDLAKLAEVDPQVRNELKVQDINGEPVTPHLRQMAPREPQPWDKQSTEQKVTGVAEASEMLKRLENSAGYAKSRGIAVSHVVSPAGAIGEYQIMPGTARQYMGKDFDVKTLYDPKVNREVHLRIVSDLYKRYNGDMTAIAIAYNAGPGRANQWLRRGAGERLEAVPDPRMRGGVRYEKAPAARDESFLPLETQKYLANARRNNGSDLPGAGKGGIKPEGQEAPRPPSEPPPPKEGAEPLENAWDAASEQEKVAAVWDGFGEQAPPVRANVWDRFINSWVSELQPAMKIDKFMEAEDGYNRRTEMGAEDWSRQTYAADLRTYHYVMHGGLNAKTLKPDGSPAMRTAFDDAKKAGGTYDGLVAYMTAMRAADLEARGIKSGFDPKLLLGVTGDKGMAAKYGEATRKFNQTMDSALDYGVDSGLFTPELRDAMVQDNPIYLKFQRVTQVGSFGGARGFRTKQPLKKIEGSSEAIVNPIESTIGNVRSIIKAADQNKALGHYVQKMREGLLPGLRQVEDADLTTFGKELEDVGLADTPENQKTYSWLLAEAAKRGLKADEFIYFENGKALKFQAESPELATLLRTTQSAGQAELITNVFQFVGKTMRGTITTMLDFPIRIFGIDQFTAMITDPQHPAMFATPIRGMFHILKKDDVYQAAVANGALATTFIDMDKTWVAKNIESAFDQTNTWARAANTYANPLQWAHAISERLTQANQVGYFAQNRVELGDLKAGTAARKAYLDFSERGTGHLANWMAGVTPFFRAGVLGVKQVSEAFARRPVETTAYAMAAITMPTVGLYALNYLQSQALDPNDPERWENIPRWQKDHYFISPIIGGQRFRFRLPPGMGFAFGGAMNRMLDMAIEKDPQATEGMLKAFLADFLPPVGIPALQTPVELVANYSFFSGDSIIPASLEQAEGYMQYTPATSETGKSLARFLGEPGIDVAEMSPVMFDHAVKSFFGPVGDFMLQALDLPYRDSKRPKGLEDIPFVKSFMVRNPGMQAADIERFYKESEELQKKAKNFSLAKMRAVYGMDPAAAEMMAEAARSKEAAVVQPIRELLTMKSRIIAGINANKDLTADEKRQLTDKEVREAIGIAKYGLKAIDVMKQARKQGVPLGGPVPVEEDVQDDEDYTPEPAEDGGELPGENAGGIPLA